MSRTEQMRSACNEFHRRHPEVWDLFVKFAFDRISVGYSHYGVGAIFERVRWETDKGGEAPELKVNNNFRAFYARRFAKEFPQHKDFFRTRKQGGRDE